MLGEPSSNASLLARRDRFFGGIVASIATSKSKRSSSEGLISLKVSYGAAVLCVQQAPYSVRDCQPASRPDGRGAPAMAR